MDKILKALSAVGLILSILPAFLAFYDVISFDQYILWLMIGTVLWFVTAPSWINKHNAA